MEMAEYGGVINKIKPLTMLGGHIIRISNTIATPTPTVTLPLNIQFLLLSFFIMYNNWHILEQKRIILGPVVVQVSVVLMIRLGDCYGADPTNEY